MQSLSGGAGALIEFLGRYVRELGGGNDKDKSEAQVRSGTQRPSEGGARELLLLRF